MIKIILYFLISIILLEIFKLKINFKKFYNNYFRSLSIIREDIKSIDQNKLDKICSTGLSLLIVIFIYFIPYLLGLKILEYIENIYLLNTLSVIPYFCLLRK